MTTELEEQFFKVFGVEKICTHTIINPESCNHRKMTRCCGCDWLEYPEITDRKLLQLLCIYNDMQSCVETCITPCKYEDIKENILQILIDEKTDITDYEGGTYMDVMTKQIKQLFKEGE